MGISIFWDNSNILLVGKNVCSKLEPGNEMLFRIHFRNLLEYVANGRTVNYAIAAGSVPPENDDLWKWFEKNNVKVIKQERGEISGKEIAVDEALHKALLERAIDTKDREETFVLLTGDGAGYMKGEGFIKELERVLALGHPIEVVSWNAGCSKMLKDFAQKNGSYRDLESVYEYVTFLEYKRTAKSFDNKFKKKLNQ